MLKEPIVTIAIPVYNGQRFIKQAIESVLQQTRKDFVLNVFDNCSTDKTAEIVKSFADPRLYYVCNEKNIGMVANWKRALASAKTRYCGVLFADDFYKTDFLDKTIFVMESQPQVGLVSGAFEHYSENNELVFSGQRGLSGLVPADEYYLWLYMGQHIPPPSETLMRTQVVSEVGGYDDQGLNWIVDTDLYLRIARAGYDAYFVKDVIACRRSWPGNSGTAFTNSTRSFLDMYTILSRYDDPARIDKQIRQKAYGYIWQYLRKVSRILFSKRRAAEFEEIFAVFKKYDLQFQKRRDFFRETCCRCILYFDGFCYSLKLWLKATKCKFFQFLKVRVSS